MRKLLYALLRLSNDINAINKGKVGKRIGRRATGKVSGRTIRHIFK